MKIKLACVMGVAALATSLLCGGSLAYADALEAESSSLLTLAPDADIDGAGNQDRPHCVFYSDGADNCIVNAQLAVVDQPSPIVGDVEPSIAEPAPAEPVVNVDADTTTGALAALAAPAGQPADAIVVAIVQSTTIAAPGQSAEDGGNAFQADSSPEPTAPVSIAEAKTTVDYETVDHEK